MVRPGAITKVFNASVTNGATVLVDCSMGRDLLIWHYMTGQTTGGYIEVRSVPDGTTRVAHHGGGTNLPTGNEAATYSCTAYDAAEQVELVLHRADGTHTVWVQVL